MMKARAIAGVKIRSTLHGGGGSVLGKDLSEAESSQFEDNSYFFSDLSSLYDSDYSENISE